MPRVRPAEPTVANPPRGIEARTTPIEVHATAATKAADAIALGLFLGLTFLLGVFPQNDTDFWWHLRTGDLIRRFGILPRTDWYTFGAADHAWIDLHWGFQVVLSWLYSIGGTDATIVAKCVITTLSVLILIATRRRGWPLWLMVLVWLPALLVLSGRMYVRPETATLLYLAIDLAVLFRIDRSPRLAWALPVVQLFWVNTQGLFVFGPILIGMALVDAALRRDAFSDQRWAWWRTVLAATLATGVACLFNPYHVFGALFPVQLWGTTSNPVFNQIGELQSVPAFVRKNGVRYLALQLQIATIILGALSFLFPIVWRVFDRASRAAVVEVPARRNRKAKSPAAAPVEPAWRLSVFRLLLYVTFTLLSWRATRNTHQFAAVVGAVTAWNFGEWAAVMRRGDGQDRAESSKKVLIPRFVTIGVVTLTIVLVGSGKFYAWTGEGRTVGWGDRPLWFARDAARFTGSDGMPDRFLVFHNGHAGIFEYFNGPDRKVYADARLEVMGPELFGSYNALGEALGSEAPHWEERVAALASRAMPGALIDNLQAESARQAATFLGSTDWRCVWYDPVASVFLHRSARHPARTVDFAERHFGLDPEAEPKGVEALIASARGLTFHAMKLAEKNQRPKMIEAMVTLGVGHARRAIALAPGSADAWKWLGELEMLRVPGSSADTIPRYRMPFDPVIDLPTARATHDLGHAATRRPDEFPVLQLLFVLYQMRGMNEAARPLADHLIEVSDTPNRQAALKQLTPVIARVQAATQTVPTTSWKNRGELERVIASLLTDGRAKTAADLIETSYAPAERAWDQTDRLATLRLHLGRPDLARAAWQSAPKPPRPALRDARIAMTYLVENDLRTARDIYRKVLVDEPTLFEAHYGLAVLERDSGHASEALAAARAALSSASSDAAKDAAEEIIRFVEPYAVGGSHRG